MIKLVSVVLELQYQYRVNEPSLQFVYFVKKVTYLSEIQLR